MASIAPLFVADADTLRASLRLSGLIENPSDADVLVDDATREVRVGFQTRLGMTRVTQIAGFAYDPAAAAPADQDEYLREVANVCEILWVRKLLLTRLPVVFRDSAGAARLDFNSEALTREIAETDRNEEIDRLAAQIEDYLLILSGSSDAQGSWKVSTFSPVCPPRLGGHIFRRLPLPWD